MHSSQARPGLISDWLAKNAEEAPDQLAFALLNDKLEISQSLTWLELAQRCRMLARKLAACHRPGETVLLLYPHGVEFTVAFCACLQAGLVAIPAPPYDPGRARRMVPRIEAILADSGARYILCSQALYETRAEAINNAPSLADLTWTTIEETLAAPQEAALPAISVDAIAYLQYTSGSTNAPKGVVIGHDQLQSYFAAHEQRMPLSHDDVIVTWLPHYHDYCLVAGILHAIYYRVPCYRMSALSFLARPHRWLHAVSRYRGSYLQAPNFAYDYCVRKLTEEQCQGLDLSSLRLVECGAEPIRAVTIAGFMERFRPYGLRENSFRPSYGLAEAVLGAAQPLIDEGCHVQTLSRTALAKGRAVVAKPGESAIEVVGCGRPLPGLSIAIVAPESQKALAAGQIGEIWLHSAQMARGYYHNPEATREAFTARLSAPAFGLPEDPYFRTGDLGFLDEQQVLYITGRCKDVIIIDGVNHYPNDIEHTVEQCHPDIVPSGVAAFPYDDGKGEQLGIWVEVTTGTDPEGVIHNTLHAVSEHHELGVACIQLLRRGTIPKTSSGKIQRHACRDAFCEGQVAPLHEWRRKDGPPPEALPQEQRAVEERLRHLLASRLGISPESIDAREPVASYGLSSRQAVSLAVELEDLFGVSLPITLFWRFPSIRAVAAFLTQEQCGEAPTAPAVAPTNHAPIAIIGMAARLPGTDTLEDFWRLLQNGREAIRRVPSDRWNAESVYHPEPGQKGKTYTLHGGFLDSVDRFDAAFFGLSGREAAQMDPQQRLLLEVTWEALEDAHCPADHLEGTDTGVFIGASHTDFARRLLSNPDLIDVHTGAGATLSIIANRISYWLGLHGPSMTIDTACSSAMVAIHQACQSLRNQECGLAIAGGVNLILAPEATIALSQAHMLSPDGRCKAFADNADGYGRGEGCGVILLKRLDDALADGDPVIGIVQGTALAQDGRSNGLTAPSEIGQALVIRRALADAHLLPDDLLFIEAHGTGTKIGDPIEVAALREVFGETRPQNLPLWIGSVKSNIGHLEAAAGIAGILKVLLAFRYHQLPATLHARHLNPALLLDGTPLRIATEPVPLPEGVPCYAGVSSFGFGGTLSHIILAAPPARQQTEAPASQPLLLVLSARTQAALRDLAQRYRDFLATTKDEPGAICAAAATGQMHFEHRLAVTGGSREDLIRRLDSYLADPELADGKVLTGMVRLVHEFKSP